MFASISLNFTFLTGSSQRGPSLVAQQNPILIIKYFGVGVGFKVKNVPWLMFSLHSFNSILSTSLGRVSSMRTLAPYFSGPKLQTLRAASISQSYFS